MIKKIKLKSFRKFSDFELNVEGNIVILLGENATGKTTILEAIHLLSTAKSPRTNDLSSLIKYDSEFAVAECISGLDRYKIVLFGNNKGAYINDIEHKKISDYIAGILMVMFSPKDINLIIGGKAERRKFFDLMISLCDKKYINALSEYKKVLKERNEILKQYNSKKDLILDIVTKKISEIGQNIINRRTKFINLLNEYINKIAKQMNLENCNITYSSSVDGEYEIVMKSKQKYDILTKTTNIGVHRDDYIFKLDEKKACDFASQGQMRSIVICLKLAIKEICELCNKREVVLLLDDVFAELDYKRQEQLVTYLLNQKQTFITTTSLKEIPEQIIKHANVLEIKKGS